MPKKMLSTFERDLLESVRQAEHGARHITRGSIFRDRTLFDPGDGAVLQMRADLLLALSQWMTARKQPPSRLARTLKITTEAVLEIQRGSLTAFTVSELVTLAARAGLNPELKLAKAA